MYDVICPVCGTVNHDLYLEETGGWMECECCGQLSKTGPALQKKLKPFVRKQKATALDAKVVRAQ